MADFEPCFAKVIRIEGGYQLTNNPGDRGGHTYAGISRVKNPEWIGWEKIDRKEFDNELSGMVKNYYREEFWNKIQGDAIGAQSVAYNLFASGVNIGINTAIRLCQKIIGVKPDGFFGGKTLSALNIFVQDEKDEQIFVLRFSIMNVFRYKTIVMSDSRRNHDLLVSDQKNLCGWINRVQAGLEYWGIQYP